ncbi:MAG: hemerythrin domain-containing protein [Chloroflexi bacterium]|nr:hemerythrin domain-containing protein [Chloroflexota bacterium]
MTTKRPDTVSQTLESEHRWIDGRFAQFQQALAGGQVVAEPFREAARVLHRHIFLEEDLLFPEVEARGLAGPTAVMAQEHGQICRMLGDVEGLITQNASPERIHDAMKALASLLEEHNLKEERVLYPSADQLLGQHDLAQLLRRFKTAKVPDGWACRAHRKEE